MMKIAQLTKEIEDCGYIVGSTEDNRISFVDETRNLRGELFLSNTGIGYTLELKGKYFYKTVLVRRNMSFDNRKVALDELESVLTKHCQLVNTNKKYLNSIVSTCEVGTGDKLRNKFESHFTQFGRRETNGIVVYGYLCDLIIELTMGLILNVYINTINGGKFKLYIKTINQENYTKAFDDVDELINDFKKNSPNINEYVELLKESANNN